ISEISEGVFASLLKNTAWISGFNAWLRFLGSRFDMILTYHNINSLIHTAQPLQKEGNMRFLSVCCAMIFSCFISGCHVGFRAVYDVDDPPVYYYTQPTIIYPLPARPRHHHHHHRRHPRHHPHRDYRHYR
ncbi:MAG: hypothetical protein AAB968_02380, partial [Patescibacteria group bacterium]